MRVPGRSSSVELVDSGSLDQIAAARYYGNGFVGELTIPLSSFSSASAVFVKLERRSWFFDEAGWLEIPPVESPPIREAPRNEMEPRLATIR